MRVKSVIDEDFISRRLQYMSQNSKRILDERFMFALGLE